MTRIICGECSKSFLNKNSFGNHQRRYHPKEINVQTSMKPDLKMNAKTSNEIVNDHLDNYRHLYDDETFIRLKRKASGKDETPYTYSKDNVPSDEVSAPSSPPRSPKPHKRKHARGRLNKQSSFATVHDLAMHMAEHHPECNDCCKQFSSQREFEEHKDTCRPWYPCTICGATFQTKKMLNEHFTSHPQCARCGGFFLTDTEVQRHWLNNHRSDVSPQSGSVNSVASDGEYPQITNDSAASVGSDDETSSFDSARTPRTSGDESSQTANDSAASVGSDDETSSFDSTRTPRTSDDESSQSTNDSIVSDTSDDEDRDSVDLGGRENQVLQEKELAQTYSETKPKLENSSEGSSTDNTNIKGGGIAKEGRGDLELALIYNENIQELNNKLLEINDLISQRQFEALVSNQELLEVLQVIFVGLIKGFLRLSKRQKSMLTKPMKRLMYKFGMTVNPALLMRNRKVLIKLVKVLLPQKVN